MIYNRYKEIAEPFKDILDAFRLLNVKTVLVTHNYDLIDLYKEERSVRLLKFDNHRYEIMKNSVV